MKEIFCILVLLLADSALAAIDCHSLSAIPTTKEECSLCPNRDFGIDLISKHMLHEEQEVCYLKECPNGYFFDARHKNCLPCDYAEQKCLDVSPEECAKCPNRQLNKYTYTTQCELPFTCPPDKPLMTLWGGFEDMCKKNCFSSCEEIEGSFWADDCSICPGYEVKEVPELSFLGKKLCTNKNDVLETDETEFLEPQTAPF